MQKDLTSKISLKEHINNIKNILKILHDIDKYYFIFTVIFTVMHISLSYISLILSAYILDSIEIGRGFKETFIVVFYIFIGTLLLKILENIIWNDLNVRKESMYNLYSCMTQTKMLSMDFSRIDSPELKDLQERIRRDTNWGSGLNSVFWRFERILSLIIDIISAAVIGFPIVKYIVETKEYKIFIMFAVLFVIVILAMKIRVHYKKKVNSFMFDKTKEEDKEEVFTFSWDFAGGYGFTYSNGKDARIYNAYDLLKRWTTEPLTSKKFRASLKDVAVGEIGTSVSDTVVNSSIEGVSYIAVVMIALAGSISAGNVLKFVNCLQRLINSIFSLATGFTDLAMEARKQMSTLELLELEDEMYKGKLPLEKRSDNQYQIEFKNVSFKYPGTENYALKNFSLKLKIGEKLAIVGMNGSGKTTMIKLLCRLYDPTEGEILLNGVNIKKFKHDEYSSLFSVVFQDYVLFPYRLAENVAIDVNYDADKVKECLVKADFGECLKELKGGIKTYMTKAYDDTGVEFSGGELQKIAIARAIYKEAPFILLDEPTAALDPLSEYEIYSNFDKIIGTKTAIYISHRLSACRFCKKIAVFHEGRLVQLGSHNELLKEKDGKYFEMWSTQAKYYQMV